ncbi:MAG: hypothetical protein Q9219_007421 [cf. Caloplaca sp. 3 TL-2023]
MGSYAPDTFLLSEDNGTEIPQPNQSLCQILVQSAKNHPDRIALVSCHQSSDLLSISKCSYDSEQPDCLRWSYAQLEKASITLAANLTSNGLNQGEAIVVILPSCAEWVLCFWAAARLGCPFVPINAAIVSRAPEIRHILSALENIGVVVVGDEATRDLLLKNSLAEIQRVKVKMILSRNYVAGWAAFEDVFSLQERPLDRSIEQRMDDTALIVLTSGTTTFPKGCPHSNRSVASMCARHKVMYSLNETRVSCNHMPLFHLAGVMESLWAWAYGGTVVYPNRSFDARATLDAIMKETCTDMCLVPSMLRAMVDHPLLSRRKPCSLRLIKLATNDVLGSDARACSEILRAKVVTNCFGMTETSGITEIYAWREGLIEDSELFPVGRMAPGAKTRICLPESRELVRRGTIGELHLGGPTVSDRYLGGGKEVSRFYTDQGNNWHITGDRAVMDAAGVITVLGRYKDIINRAGENISASVIEKILKQINGVVASYVVGVPDEIAGEVPIAVMKMVNDLPVPKDLIHERVVKELGLAFALERVMDLNELEVTEFPTTATGKVRKVEIRQLVLDRLSRESKDFAPTSFNMSTTENALTRIWARYTGVPESQILPTMSLEGMVDSVTVMRFRSRVKKELGKSFTLEELNAHPTIVEQAAILDRQMGGMPQATNNQFERVRQGPPQLKDVAHAHGKIITFDEIKKAAVKQLHTLDLSWDKDVEEVLPIYDFLQYWRSNTGSIVFRIGVTCAKATTRQLRSALEMVLAEHGMLRTILIQNSVATPSWVMIRASRQWFDLAIKDGGNVGEPEDILTADLSYPGSKDPKPIPLFFIKMFFIESTQSAAFVAYGDHSTYDAHSVLSLFVEDLGKAMYNPTIALPMRPKYNLFANAYYNYRTSVPAQLNVDYFAARIKGLARRREGLWPSESFHSRNGPPERSADHLLLTGNITPGIAGIARHIRINMSNNKYLKAYKIPHSVAIKAAIAFYNTQQTGHPYAFFNNLQMCRNYPFLDRQIADRLPDVMDMPGATIEIAFDSLYLDPDAHISTFLKRLESEQTETTARAQVPWLLLEEQIDVEDAKVLAEVLQRQAINYNPVVTPDPNAPLQNVQFAGNANLSIMWWCGMVDVETVQMRLTWNDEVLGIQDAEAALDGFERNMKWLVDGDNWERTIRDCGS